MRVGRDREGGREKERGWGRGGGRENDIIGWALLLAAIQNLSYDDVAQGLHAIEGWVSVVLLSNFTKPPMPGWGGSVFFFRMTLLCEQPSSESALRASDDCG